MLSLRVLPRLRCDAKLLANTAARAVSTATGANTSAYKGSKNTTNGTKTARSWQTAATSPQTVVLMEPTTLCKTFIQTSKEGKSSKATWKGHIRRAIEIKDQLTFKHIAILIHSCANARIDGKQLQSLVHGLQGNIMAYLERSLANIATGTTKIELYHIYSILHGVIASGYSNPEMTVMLKEAAMVQFRNLSSDAGEESIKPFIFEDIAGIIHALAQMQAEVDQRDITMIHNVFVKLYEKDTRGESTISHRAFAIIVNTLDRLGCHTQTLGQIISEYIQRHVHAMNNIKDVAMIYCTATRIYPRIHNIDDGKCYNWATRTRIGQTMALTGDTTVNCGSKEIRMDNTFGQCDIIHLTSLVIRQLIQPDDPGGNVYSDVKSIANIAAHAAPFAEIADEELLEQFGVFIGNAIQRAMQNTTIDHTSLVHLMSCAIRLNRTYDAMIMLSSDNIDCVGMLATPQEFAKHMANIHALRSKQSDEKVTKIMDSIAVTNMLHFQYRLERPPLTIKPKPQRRRNLRDLIIAESKKDSHVENICIFNDLDKHFKGPNGFSLCAKTLAAIGVFSGHKSAVEIAQRMVTTMQHICAFDNIYTNVESIAAAATGLYRFRIKNEDLLRRMALEVKKNLNAVHHPATLVQMLVAYAKLSCPLNRDINRGLVASPGNKRHTRSNKWRSNQQVYEQLFVDVARFIVSKKLIKHLNTQSTVNGIFAVALAGMGHRIPSFLYKLLVKLRKEYPGALKFQEMDKQYKIATTVLGKTCNKQSRLICRELKRLRKVQLSNVKGAIATKDDTVKYYDAQRVTVSGLHRDVWRYLATGCNGATIRSEVPCSKGIYYIDMVVKRGILKTYLEVDGPTHFIHATHEVMPISKLKHAILRIQGKRVIHAPYYSWQQAMLLLKPNVQGYNRHERTPAKNGSRNS